MGWHEESGVEKLLRDAKNEKAVSLHSAKNPRMERGRDQDLVTD